MPVLLLHGEEDTTVPYTQSSTLDGRADINVRLVELAGADHYLGNTATRKQVLKESLAFLAQNHPAK